MRSLSLAASAVIAGRTIPFATIEQKFEALVEAWHELRGCGSSAGELHNSAYLQIIGMGERAVPLLLREVERETGHWFSALKHIVGAEIVRPEEKGNIPAMREAWLRWGKENGYDTYNRQGMVAKKASAQTARSRLRLGK